MKNKIIEIILNNGEKFVSGEELSNSLGVSRTAIWKHINKLKEEGYDIESVNRKGYRLASHPQDLLTFENINHDLNTTILASAVEHLNTVDSTNEYLKRIGDKSLDGTVVISEEQTKGKGRLGRQWYSAPGEGIWMSILLKPQIAPYKAPFITLVAGVSIVKVLRNMGVPVEIKWPNDVILNGKKICGVLTELSTEIERINFVVVGIGMNVKQLEFDGELESKGTSLHKEGYKLSRLEIVKKVLLEFEHLYKQYTLHENKDEVLELFRKYSNVINREVYLVKGDKKELVTCIDINENGNLIVKDELNNTKEVMSGEVSVRGVNGYI